MDPAGCADGTREWFTDATARPAIAGCAGGWDQPGVWQRAPACARLAGNTSGNPAGVGCTVEDLCAAGWHVCRGAGDVAARTADCGATGGLPLGTLFATQQSGPGWGCCATATDPSDTSCATDFLCAQTCYQTAALANDVFGCGNAGGPGPGCGPLNASTGNACGSVTPEWQCGADVYFEAANLRKTGPAGGGVLCCKDP